MHLYLRSFSGTGNTFRAAGLIAQAFVAQGWTVDQAEVRWDSPVPDAGHPFDLAVLACPTLGFSAPVPFLRWLARWPRGLSGQSAVLAVCGAGGHPAGGIPQVSRRLRRTGLSVVSTAVAEYPTNWTQVMAPPSAESAQATLAGTDQVVAGWAQALTQGTGDHDRRKVPWIMPVVGVLFRLAGRRFLGKLFAADPTCTRCGHCAHTCPAGTIRMEGGQPRWGWDCCSCNRCINVCPSASVQVTWARLGLHGGGHLVFTVAAVWWALAGHPAEALALYVGGSVLQLTAVDALWARLESLTRWPWLFRGWTQSWGRYRAPGFHG